VDRSDKAPGLNRTITRFVGGFALASLAAACAPLLSDDAGRSLIPGLSRADAFAVYGMLIAGLPALVLPTGFAVQPGRDLSPLAPLILLATVFAVLPLAVAAWISGVAWTGVSAVVSASLALGALMLHLRRLLGPRAAVLCGAVGAALCVAAPLHVAFLETLGKPWPPLLAFASPSVMVLASARMHGFEAHLVPVSVAVAAWLLLFARPRTAATVGCIGMMLLPGARAADFVGPSEPVTISAVAGSRTRVGVPIPLEIENAGAPCVVRLRGESWAFATGEKRVVFVAIEEGEAECVVETTGSSARSIPLPITLANPDRPILLVARGSRAEAAAVAVGAEVVDADRLAATSIHPTHADGFVLATDDRPTTSTASWLSDAATLGLRVWSVGGPAPAGIKATEFVPGGPPPTDVFRPKPALGDPAIRTLFAAPDWRAIDLTRLLLFLAAYHVAFLAAFLLPVSLDSKKSTGVYLTSVGFIIVATALAGRWVLRGFFLKDNQIYTQSLTLVSVGADGRAAARQIRSFASMSGERAVIPVPSGGTTVVYRSPGRPAPTRRVSATGEALVDVWLDRVDAKVLMRDDRVGPSPVAVEASGPGRWRLRPVEGVPDPFGIGVAAPVEAAVVLKDGGLVPLRVEGRDLLPAEGAEGFRIDAAARALLGRFAPFAGADPGAGTGGILVRLGTSRRPDSTEGCFEVSDRGAIIAAPLPSGR